MFLHIFVRLLRVIAFRICLVFTVFCYCTTPQVTMELPTQPFLAFVAAHLAHAAAVDTSKASAPLRAEAASK